MAQIELIMPKMGESVAEATITKWLVSEGESIEAEESILEIATDKVDSEIPAPESCVVSKHLYKEGDVVKVGEAIAILETAAGTSDTAPKTADKKEEKAPEVISQTEVEKEPVIFKSAASNNGNIKIERTSESGKFYSPLVRSIAQKEGVSMGELENISGTGLNGRVTKKDILDYLPNRSKEIAHGAIVEMNGIVEKLQEETINQKPESSTIGIQIKQPEIVVNPGDEIVEMDRMRKLIADHMVMSKHVSPHVTSYVEADVTNIVMWREKNKDAFFKREGEKITFTPIFAEAVIKAIKDFPGVNVSVKGTSIIKRKNINLGMATALPSGNLIVPVIKNADGYNLTGLTKAVNDLALRARENKLLPDEIQGGTYTITNVGTFGNVMGTPIINQPQVAILAIGAIRKMPAVIETPMGDTIGIRHKMFLSHAYDHRVVDGALGGMFVRRVADYLENFDVNRTV